MDENTRPDTWRHMIVAASFSTLLFCSSTMYSNGVFLVAFKDTGLYDVTTLSWLMAFSNTMHAVGGPVSSLLITLTSCRAAVVIAGIFTFVGFILGSLSSDVRILFIAYGLLIGIGRGTSFATTNVNIGYWFREDSSIACGLTTAGVGVGMLIHPRLVQAFIDWYGIHGAQLMMGAVSFHTCICGLLLRPSSFEKGRHNRSAEETPSQVSVPCAERMTDAIAQMKPIWTNGPFLLFMTGVCLFNTSFLVISTFIPDYFNLRGSTHQESAMAASIIGCGGLLSRVLAGVMTNDPNIGTMLLLSSNCGISGILTLLLPLLAGSEAGRYIYSFCIGTYLTCIYVVLGPTTLQKVGLQHLAYGFGFMFLNTGIGNLIGPPIAAYIRYRTNSYYALFVFTACLLLAASCCGFLSEIVTNNDVKDAIPAQDTLLRIDPIEQIRMSESAETDPWMFSASDAQHEQSLPVV
ncbi:monocarboxylate transporter 13-like [Haliotis cracherodii]|uniref:monocarboxylate transporter 13-like n=1 Tax=Haliotis cracherodii TaxID=6455 RepID=UPI0039ED113E